jgi:Ca2+-binding RTX toxin-like protein
LGAVQQAPFLTGLTDGETITSGIGADRLFGGGGNDVLNADLRGDM